MSLLISDSAYEYYTRDYTFLLLFLCLPIDPNIPTANVGFVEPKVEVLESQDVRLICLLFTTTSPLEEEVKASVTSSDGTAMSFSTELGKKATLQDVYLCDMLESYQ